MSLVTGIAQIAFSVGDLTARTHFIAILWV